MSVGELLLSKGVNLYDKDNNGYSPIMLASGKGHVIVGELLLSKGANPNDKNIRGDTALTLATAKGHIKIVRLLTVWPLSLCGYYCVP